MILWMAWSTLVSLLLGFAALAAERSVRATGRSTRGVWGLAILGGLVLQAWALLRTGETLAPNSAASVNETSATISVLTELQATAASLPALLDRYETVALLAWLGAAVVAVAVLLGGLSRLESLAKGWGRVHVAGEDVLISEDFGPALFGLRAPTIVLPGWALDLPSGDLRLACLHEAEHRKAHDTWLLFGAALVASLTPWNAALWWNVRRFRAAVEIDCDARVLSASASPTEYGALLLELTSSIGDHRLPVPTFTKPQSLLERRLTMIVSNVSHGVPVGSLAALAVCALLVVAACETVPTMALPGQDSGTAVEATALEEAGGVVTPVSRIIRLNGRASVEGEQPLIYVDGIRINSGLPDLDPSSIERIEVIKGQAAHDLYGDEASGGVIQIFLKLGTKQSDDPADGSS